MLLTVLPLLIAAVGAQELDPATSQLLDFKEKTGEPIGILTTLAGAPVDYNEATSTLNTNILLNEHFLDELTSLTRERIPERVVHAPGTGASGYFEVTHNISHICKADLFSKVGKKTPIAARLAIAFSRIGGRDTSREVRSLAVKFYTEEGNLDLIGVNTEIFTFRNPSLFSALTHSFKRNPATNLPDPLMMWDYVAKNGESLHQLMYLMSDHGVPVTYRHMSAHCVHTYQVYNDKGVSSYVRFHMIPAAGEKYFNSTGVLAVTAGDPDYYARDLYNTIAKGEPAKWYLKAQILSEKDRKNAAFDIFDLTLSLPQDKYPLHDIGVIVLNKNPINHFAEVEQIALCPANVVPGILGAPDKVFETRCLAYRDAHNYRLGGNSKKIPINCPFQAYTYTRDGVAPVNNNGKDAPNYKPNSFNGPEARVEKNRPSLLQIVEKPANSYKQAGDFYAKRLTTDGQNQVVENIVESLSVAPQFLQEEVLAKIKLVNKSLAKRVAAGIAK